MKKAKKQIAPEAKKQAVDDYVSGRKSAAQAAAELGVAPNLVYRWKSEFGREKMNDRIEELQAEGHNAGDIRRIMQLEAELEEYKKKLAEQILINDLLKKLRDLRTSPLESELTGLINTMKHSDRKRKVVK